jgi:hypothetical protein
MRATKVFVVCVKMCHVGAPDNPSVGFDVDVRAARASFALSPAFDFHTKLFILPLGLSSTLFARARKVDVFVTSVCNDAKLFSRMPVVSARHRAPFIKRLLLGFPGGEQLVCMVHVFTPLTHFLYIPIHGLRGG